VPPKKEHMRVTKAFGYAEEIKLSVCYPIPRISNLGYSLRPGGPLEGVMTHKYRGCIVVLSINKSVEPNEEQKVLTSGFDQGFTVNTSKRVFRGIW
jgi:hypothetical protein